MPLKKRKTIGQVDPRAKKLKQLRRQEQSRRLGTLHQTAAEAGQQLESNTDSTPGASTVHAPPESRDGEESGCDIDARGRPPQPAWERGDGDGTGLGLSSFVDSFSQSLEILGSRTVDDDAAVGVTAEAAPSSAYPAGSPEAPYPVADPAGLRELQRAMGATDEEMAILQQLGGEGPIWAPVKIEVSPSTSMCVPKREEEEEEEEKVDITGLDLDRQWTAPETPPAEVSCESGEGAAVTSGTTGGPPAGVGGAAAAARPDPAVGSLTRQRPTGPAAEDGDGAEDLLAGYEAKEMVCPACYRLFLGVSALQQHVRAAHDGRVDRRRKNDCSSVSTSAEAQALTAAAASVLRAPTDAPHRPVCPLCREVVKRRDAAAAKDALAAHVAEEHPGSAATIDSAMLPTLPDPPSDESVGLKTHISTVLGGLLGCSALRWRRKRRLERMMLNPKAHRPTTEAESGSGTSSSGRPRKIVDTELARHFWQQMSAKAAPTEQEVERASASASGKLHLYPYACFYCECRFEKQWGRTRHVFRAHRNEIPASVSEQLEPEVDPDSEDRDCDGSPPKEVGPHSGADTEPPVWMFEPAKRGRPPGRSIGICQGGGVVRLYTPGDEGARKKAMEALRALGEEDGRFRKRRGRARGKAKGRSRRVPVRAAEPIQEKTGSFLSQKRDIEVVFVNEQTSFPPDCELPDGYDNARDPLSVEEEIGAFPKAEFSICDVHSIKEEVLEAPVAVSGFSGCIKVDQDVDIELEGTDNKVYSNL